MYVPKNCVLRLDQSKISLYAPQLASIWLGLASGLGLGTVPPVAPVALPAFIGFLLLNS
jgi:hypothetical protein